MKTELSSAVVAVAIAMSACSSTSAVADGYQVAAKVPEELLIHIDAARSAWAVNAKRTYVDSSEETWLVSYFAEPKLMSGVCFAEGELAEMSLATGTRMARVVEREAVAVGHLPEQPSVNCVDVGYEQYFDMDAGVRPAQAAAAIEVVALAQRCIAESKPNRCREIDKAPSGPVADAFSGIAARLPLRVAAGGQGFEVWYRPPAGLEVDLLRCIVAQEGGRLRVREVRGGQL